MSETLKNNKWSSGSVDYSFSINWDRRKWIPIVYFTMWHDPRRKHCHTPILRIVFRYMFWHLWVIYCHYNAKTLLFTFLWLEFRFKSFLELHMHFKGFMCIRMRKLHQECEVPADAHVWCQIAFSLRVPKCVSKYLTTKQLSQMFRWSVRTLAQYTIYMYYKTHKQFNF